MEPALESRDLPPDVCLCAGADGCACVVCVGWDLTVLVRASVFLYLYESSLQMKKMHRVGKPRGGKDGGGPQAHSSPTA